MRLATVRESIDRGIERLDLGPGDFAYKRDFGGEQYTRLKVDVTSTSLAGRMMRERLRSEHRLRNAPMLRRGVMRWRALRRARYAPRRQLQWPLAPRRGGSRSRCSSRRKGA